jgi:hypothetical protein
VIQRNYQSPHVEGPAATFDPFPTVLRVKLPFRLTLFGRGIIGLAQPCSMTMKPTFPHDP